MGEINWKQYFNKKADTFGSSVMTSDYFNEKSFYTQRDNTLKWLGELKGKVILDAGCGVGAFSETLTGDNTVYGVDFSEKSLEFAKGRGLETVCGDLGELPFADGKFDVVLCIGVVQLIEEYERVLKELARVLKPGGTLLIETLNKQSLQRKLYAVVNKAKKFDRMYDTAELAGAYKRLGLKDIEFLSLYHPFRLVTWHKGSTGACSRYFSTSFAVKGKKE